MLRILYVEDDAAQNRAITAFLSENGYEVKSCLSASEAEDAFSVGAFDLVITDVMMPGTDGFSFSEGLRLTDKEIPILFITALDDLASKARGFRIGADDYMVKPIAPEELLLRVEALLRRARVVQQKRLVVGRCVLDLEEHAAYLDGEEIPLTVREFNLLFKLLSYPKKTFTRSRLMEEFWEYDTASSPRTVDVYITKIREKLSACEDFEIVTVHGLGYKAVLK